MGDPADSAGITWISDAEGTVALGVKRILARDGHALALVRPGGDLIRTLDRDDAARLIEKLQTGATFADIVGDSRFSLDLDEP